MKTYYVSLFSPVKELGEVYIIGKYSSGVTNYIYEINTLLKERKLGLYLIKKEHNEYSSYTQKQNKVYKKKYNQTPKQYLISLHKIPKKEIERFKLFGSMN